MSPKPVCLFAAFRSGRALPRTTLAWIAALARWADVVVIANDEGGTTEECTRVLRAVGAEYHEVPNEGVDYGKWLRFLDRGQGAPRVWLVNDSMALVADPEEALRAVSERTEDVVGLTDSYETAWHIQSYFISYSPRAFALFSERLSRLGPPRSSVHAIVKYELATTQYLVDRGCSARVLWPSDEVMRQRVLAVNLTARVAPELIAMGFPLLKRRFFNDPLWVEFAGAEVVRQWGRRVDALADRLITGALGGRPLPPSVEATGPVPMTAAPPPSIGKKTLAAILHYNTTECTDPLYEALKPHEGNDYDLIVIDNGSSAGRRSKYATHVLPENRFFGGGLNYAFELVMDSAEYDSLLFLNSDLIVHGAGFVRALREEMSRHDRMMIISPCITHPGQVQCTWRMMANWYRPEVRLVRWVDFQCPLFRRPFIEMVGQFDERLSRGWGQDVWSGLLCAEQGLTLGVLDRASAVHLNSYTVRHEAPDYNHAAQRQMAEYFAAMGMVEAMRDLQRYGVAYVPQAPVA